MMAGEFAARCRRALGALRSGLPVVDAFPVLRELEPLREAAFGPRSWPGVLIKSLPDGGWHLATSVPDVDFVHKADLPERLTAAESDEIRNHLILVVENWLNWAEVQREIPDPAESVLESLRWFLSLSPIELVQRAAGVGRFDLLPLFKLSHPRGATIEQRGGMGEVVPGPSAIDEVAESLLAGPMSAMGAEVARRWDQLAAAIHGWRDDVRERKTQWEWDHIRELSPAVDLREALGDGVVEQTERLRTDAGALIRLIERARDVAVAPQAVPAGDPGDGLSDDGRTLFWGGREFPLSAAASRLVQVLLDSVANGQRWNHNNYLKAEGGFESDVRTIVRDAKLRDVVVPQPKARGMWGLIDRKELKKN